MSETPRLYAEFAEWWPVMSSPEDYDLEAKIFVAALDGHVPEPPTTLFELGSGGGNNALHMKRRYEMTLVDISPGMLAVSRELNPECGHEEGDMRTVRLGRTFDAVFVHDAIMYMTTEEDLLAAFRTAFVHTRPGGSALFVPDFTTENFEAGTRKGGHDVGDRSMRYLQWDYDPDPEDTTHVCAFAYLFREGNGPVKCASEEHLMGLFPRATWVRLMEAAGFAPKILPYDGSTFDPPVTGEMFLGIHP